MYQIISRGDFYSTIRPSRSNIAAVNVDRDIVDKVSEQRSKIFRRPSVPSALPNQEQRDEAMADHLFRLSFQNNDGIIYHREDEEEQISKEDTDLADSLFKMSGAPQPPTKKEELPMNFLPCPARQKERG